MSSLGTPAALAMLFARFAAFPALLLALLVPGLGLLLWTRVLGLPQHRRLRLALHGRPGLAMLEARLRAPLLEGGPLLRLRPYLGQSLRLGLLPHLRVELLDLRLRCELPLDLGP